MSSSCRASCFTCTSSSLSSVERRSAIATLNCSSFQAQGRCQRRLRWEWEEWGRERGRRGGVCVCGGGGSDDYECAVSVYGRIHPDTSRQVLGSAPPDPRPCGKVRHHSESLGKLTQDMCPLSNQAEKGAFSGSRSQKNPTLVHSSGDTDTVQGMPDTRGRGIMSNFSACSEQAGFEASIT